MNQHKTRVKGSAKLSIDNKKTKYIHQHVCLRLGPGDSQLIFVMPGGKQIEKANILLKKLEKFGISVPTATRARKIGETAASTLPQQKQNLISTQLSHTPATAAKYYKAIRSIDKVAEGYSLIKSLGSEADPESSSKKQQLCRGRRK